MMVTEISDMVLRRFPSTPSASEPHGAWRARADVVGTAAGGNNNAILRSPRKLFFVILGWNVRNVGPAEYRARVAADELEEEMELTAGTLVPSADGFDVASARIYLPVFITSALPFNFFTATTPNVDTIVFSLQAHGLWWDEALLRKVDATPTLRP